MMITWLDVLIGILIVFITVTPFIWKGKKSKYILIISAVLCIVLYIFQGFSKYEKDKEFESLKEEDKKYREKIIKQQDELSKSQQTMIKKQNIFESKLDELVETKVMSEESAKEVKHIFYETLSSGVKVKDKIEIKLIPSDKSSANK